MYPEKIASTLSELTRATAQLGTATEETARIKSLEAARKLVTELEKPEDSIIKAVYAPVHAVALRVGIETGLFKAISESEAPVTLTELATKTGAEALLLERLLRTLTPVGYVGESDVNKFHATEVTHALNSRTGIATVKYIYDVGLHSMVKLPEFLAQNHYKSPIGLSNGPFQYAEKTQESTWEWESKDPAMLDTTNSFMEGAVGSRPLWWTWFSVQKQLLDGYDVASNGPLIVDVGGGRGHDLAALKKAYPDQQGAFILQDRDVVIDDIHDLDPSIQRMKHDFFTPQPVKGARIYYMKGIMHDWSDEKCTDILNQLKAVLTKGYSKIVIEDFVLPDKGCPLLPALWDIEMMVFLGSMERTESRWRTLLESTGLHVQGVHSPPGDGTGIIIAEL